MEGTIIINEVGRFIIQYSLGEGDSLVLVGTVQLGVTENNLALSRENGEITGHWLAVLRRFIISC